MMLRSHLAEGEDDVLVVLTDVVHAGVIPGRYVLLGNVTIRRVTLVIPLSQRNSVYNTFLLIYIDISHPLTDTVFVSGHNKDGDEDNSEEANERPEYSEADGVSSAPESELLRAGREDTEQGGRVHEQRFEARVIETAAVSVITPSAVVFTALWRLGLCLRGQWRCSTH